MPDRPWMSGCHYHDMVKETIQMAAAKNLDRVRQHVEGGQAREADRDAFRRSRFQRQHETAALWADIQSTYGLTHGRSAQAASTLPGEAEQALVPPATPAPSIPASASASAAPSAAPSQGPGTASYMPLRSASMPGLQRVPHIVGGKLLRDGGRCPSRVGVGLGGLRDFVPFPQEPGSRGFPPDYCPAHASQMGVVAVEAAPNRISRGSLGGPAVQCWDKDRSYTIQGMRARGWA